MLGKAAMRLLLSQARAVGLLAYCWARGAPVPASASRTPLRLAVWISLALFWAVCGYAAGHRCAAPTVHGVAATHWLLAGLLGYCAALGFISNGGGLLAAPILEALPIMETSRVTVILLVAWICPVLAVPAIYAASPPPNLTHAAAFGLTLSSSGLLTGIAAGRLLRVAASPTRFRTILVTVGVPSSILFSAFAVAGPELARWSNGRPFAGALTPVALTALQRGGSWLGWLYLVLAGAISCLGIAAAEGIGYDHLEALHTHRVSPAANRHLTLRGMGPLLARREPGPRPTMLAFVFCGVCVGAVLSVALRIRGMRTGGETWILRGVLAACALPVFGSVWTRASRLAERDSRARPLLAPLPVLPKEVLGGMGAVLRRDAIFGAAPLAALLALPSSAATRWEATWRLGAFFLALSLTAKATVAMAFLTKGVGRAQVEPDVGVGFPFERALLVVPLIGVAAAADAWSVGLSLICIGLVASAARRAADDCIRWCDDADDFERDTSVWRALVVFAAFQGVQALSAQILVAMSVAPGNAQAIAFATSALLLLPLTFSETRRYGPMRFGPVRARYVPLGLAGGLASGTLAVGYLSILARFGVQFPPVTERYGASWLAPTLVLVAPVAEEVFFRGWLQRAIGEQYAARGPWFAVATTAVAFALVHPPISFVPVLVLGLVTGGLFARSGALGPAIVAHAVHNLIVVAGPFP